MAELLTGVKSIIIGNSLSGCQSYRALLKMGTTAFEFFSCIAWIANWIGVLDIGVLWG